MINVFDNDKLIQECLVSRRLILQIALSCGNNGAHIGGSLSLVEIMNVLYGYVMKLDVNHPNDEYRDRLILSKGHGVMALYVAMANYGYLPNDELFSFKKNNSILPAHPKINQDKFIEFSSGSLGQGLSLGVGTALGLKLKNNFDSKVYIVLGDGECNEGQIWEAAESASHFKLNNLIVIIDNNHLQYDGTTNEIMSNEPFAMKWQSFGFDVDIIDGHNCKDIYDAIIKKSDKPKCIIANTIKGKGISFIENNYIWHSHSLTKDQYDNAMRELDNDNN